MTQPTHAAPHPIESALEKLQHDVTRLNGQVRRSQRLSALGTAAAMMAHEFNNLMTPIVGYARFALNSQDPELMTKALETTLKQAESVTAMAERILGMAADGPLAFQSVTVLDIVDDAVKCLCRDLSKDGITVNMQVDTELKVWADPKQMRQVFFNLLLNARDAFNGNSGTITIDAHADDDTVRINVTDTGCGISSDVMDSIFDAFFTTKDASTSGGQGGSGLGLAVCRDIVDEHRGDITVKSLPNQGTTFTITLPIAP